MVNETVNFSLFIAIYSIIYLDPFGLMDIYILGYNIYILGYNILLHFVLKLFQLWPSFWLSVSSWSSLTYHYQFFSGDGTLPYFLALEDAHGSSCRFLASVLHSATLISSKAPHLFIHSFISLENDFRNQDLGSSRACCSWSAITSKPSQITRERNICVHTNPIIYTCL